MSLFLECMPLLCPSKLSDVTGMAVLSNHTCLCDRFMLLKQQKGVIGMARKLAVFGGLKSAGKVWKKLEKKTQLSYILMAFLPVHFYR